MMGIEAETLMKLLLALFFGGLIGLEREFNGKPAGLRTHILVCVASTVLMLVQEFPSKSAVDPGRIVAGIVTGIGFLGAGVIIREGDTVRGLTTAAGIWFTAALGILIGGGQYLLALGVTVICLVVLLIFDRVDHLIHSRVRRKVSLSVSEERMAEVEEEVVRLFREDGLHIQDQWHAWDGERKLMEIGYLVRTRQRMQSGIVIGSLSELEGVRRARWE